jgi:Amt family ammonium transporter
VSYIVFKGIDAIIPLRVNGDLEEMGLDLHEHDAEANPEFGEKATAPTSA